MKQIKEYNEEYDSEYEPEDTIIEDLHQQQMDRIEE